MTWGDIGVPWGDMGCHGVPLGCHGNTWGAMGYHGVTWGAIGVPWGESRTVAAGVVGDAAALRSVQHQGGAADAVIGAHRVDTAPPNARPQIALIAALVVV